MSNSSVENSLIYYTGSKVRLGHDKRVSFLAIDLLYGAKQEFFADHMGFILSSSNEQAQTGSDNYILKLEAAGLPNLNNGKLQITHQIEPKLGRCTRIVTIDSHNKLGCFDTGFVSPINDFGCRKTFNFDVRASEKHPFIDGQDAQLYQHGNEVKFWLRKDLRIDVIGNTVFKIKTFHVCPREDDKTQPDVIIFGTDSGLIVLVDQKEEHKKIFWMHQDETLGPITRIKLAKEPDGKPIVVYANSSPDLQMLDFKTGNSCKQNWICDRIPEVEQLDFVQVGSMIVSCGRECSIASWLYNRK